MMKVGDETFYTKQKKERIVTNVKDLMKIKLFSNDTEQILGCLEGQNEQETL